VVTRLTSKFTENLTVVFAIIYLFPFESQKNQNTFSNYDTEHGCMNRLYGKFIDFIKLLIVYKQSNFNAIDPFCVVLTNALFGLQRQQCESHHFHKVLILFLLLLQEPQHTGCLGLFFTGIGSYQT
jgi:hypothetical protein